MAQDISPPIFVFEGLDLSIYDSIDSMRRGLEGVDVDDGIYEAFDSVGCLLRLSASGVERGTFVLAIGEIGKVAREQTPTAPVRFYTLLWDYLKAIGHTPPTGAPLSALVAASVAAQAKQS